MLPVFENENLVLLKRLVLLYADNTDLLFENEHELQQTLHDVNNY